MDLFPTPRGVYPEDDPERRFALIVGYGFIGKAVHRFLSKSKKYGCFCHPDRSCCVVNHDTLMGSTLEQVIESYSTRIDIAFICVPTPAFNSGAPDLGAVFDVAQTLKKYNLPIVIKSTVPPGTTSVIQKTISHNTVFSPEFIGETERTFKDLWEYPVNYCGGDPELCEKVKNIYTEIYDILGKKLEFKIIRPDDLEVLKYMINCYLSVKLSFCKEFYDIAQKTDADYTEVKTLFELDPRVGTGYTDMENISLGYVFGGKCLPKDLAAMVALYGGNVLAAAQKTNKSV